MRAAADSERTLQRMDPMSTLSAPRTVAVAGAVILVYIVAAVLVDVDEIVRPLTVVLSVVVYAIAVFVVVRAADPFHAPVTRRVLFGAVALAVGAHALYLRGTWEANPFVEDDWGPLAIGALCVMFAALRPAREIVLAGVLASIPLLLLTLGRAQELVYGDAVGVLVVVTVAPVLCLSIATGVFTSDATRRMSAWRADLADEWERRSDSDREGILRQVQQDRAGILRERVVPFFGDLLERDRIGESDRHTAAEIARQVREVMLVDIERSWLEAVVLSTAKRMDARTVDDPHRLAALMTPDRRAALRALVVAAMAHPGVHEEGLRIALRRAQRDDVEVVVHAALDAVAPSTWSDLKPYVVVVGGVFDQLRVTRGSTALTLKFSYGRD